LNVPTITAENSSLDGLPGGLTPTAGTPRADALTATLFIAALFHCVLILGVTFTAFEPGSSSDDIDAMEVVLLTRDYEKRNAPEDAAYLAQQSLTGSGNTEQDDPLRVAYGRGTNPVLPGPEQKGIQQKSQRPADQDQAQELLYARNPDAEQVALYKPRTQSESRQLETGMPGTANTVEILALPDTETVLKGAKPRQLIVSASTRESRIATYLDGWKRRVERVGTMNIPALDKIKRNPILSVTISASGDLAEVIIVTGSGSGEPDRAAVNILRMAAPFEVFPEFMRNDYDSLKFSYEWRFSGGSVGKMRVPN
jgi:protein TonB